MCEALRRIRDLAAEWVLRPENAESFPPVVFNITDGEATDCDGEELRTVAEQIRSLATADGNVLLVNIHIATAADMRPLLFPEPSEEHYANRYASLLYDCSSTMPEPFHAAIRELKGGRGAPALPRPLLQRLGRRAGLGAQHRLHQRQNRIRR